MERWGTYFKPSFLHLPKPSAAEGAEKTVAQRVLSNFKELSPDDGGHF